MTSMHAKFNCSNHIGHEVGHDNDGFALFHHVELMRTITDLLDRMNELEEHVAALGEALQYMLLLNENLERRVRIIK